MKFDRRLLLKTALASPILAILPPGEETLIIRSSGNVGFGVNSPNAILHVGEYSIEDIVHTKAQPRVIENGWYIIGFPGMVEVTVTNKKKTHHWLFEAMYRDDGHKIGKETEADSVDDAIRAFMAAPHWSAKKLVDYGNKQMNTDTKKQTKLKSCVIEQVVGLEFKTGWYEWQS